MPRLSQLRRFAPLLGAFLFLLATNRYLVTSPDMSIYRFDSVSYVEIARHAPSLPHQINVCQGHPEANPCEAVDIPYHHAQRLIGPWIIGVLARATGLSVEALFLASAILLIAGVLLEILKIAEEAGAGPRLQMLVPALVLLNPFFGRFYLAVPTYLPDLLFWLGSSLVVRGMIRKDHARLMVGVLIAAIGRQTALMWLPAVALYCWSHRQERAAWATMAFSTVSTIGIYLLTGHWAAMVNALSINGAVALGFINWVRDAIRGTEGSQLGQLAVPLMPLDSKGQSVGLGLAGFLTRAVFPFLFLAVVLAVEAFLAPKRTSRLRGTALRNTLLLGAACIIAQPLMGGPILTGATVGRLTALAMPAIAGLILISPNRATIEQALGRKSVWFAIWILVGLGSFHHRTFLVDLGMRASPLFFAIQLLSALAMGVCLIWGGQQLGRSRKTTKQA